MCSEFALLQLHSINPYAPPELNKRVSQYTRRSSRETKFTRQNDEAVGEGHYGKLKCSNLKKTEGFFILRL